MNNKEFGQLLAALRHSKNMSQSELASKLGVSTSSVSKWENGKNYPDMPTFHKIAQLFEISFDDLHDPTGTLSRLSKEIPSNTPAVSLYSKSKPFIVISILAFIVVLAFLFITLI